MDHLKPLLDRLALNDALVVRPTGHTEAYVAYRGKAWRVFADDRSFYLSRLNTAAVASAPTRRSTPKTPRFAPVLTA